MAINVKKYTKEQMEKMVEDTQEKTAALEAEITELKNCKLGSAFERSGAAVLESVAGIEARSRRLEKQTQ